MSEWRETDLWKALEQMQSPAAKDAKLLLERAMPDIAKVLSAAGTGLLDFTLHDHDHAFRVAQRMAKVVPSDVLPKLSPYELTLLLLSAYLHDIGMTPERGKVSSHYKFLLTAEGGLLSLAEQEELQAWLDDEGSGVVPPLPNNSDEVARLQQAEQLTAYYCRHRHNDWSGEWIRQHASLFDPLPYPTWLDDLVAISKSHHYGYAELIDGRFDPRIAGTAGEVVHPRYIACALRVADILEFDPERTPKVIFEHRDIAQSSRIYWWKDHHIALNRQDSQFVMSARPPNAYIHRAIEETIDGVEAELALCHRLADETNFQFCKGLGSIPHRWDLRTSIHRDISPKENSYEFIDGTFRPDVRKILALLSGTALYGNSLAAVRELLQNAFDAIREEIAWQRLSQPNPSDPLLEQTFGNLHWVKLHLRTKGGSTVLVCTDDGVGMTKSIICNYFLVSGAAQRHYLFDLERRCKNAGFLLSRSGQFGIGALSYFMLAKRLVLRTRRSQRANDAEQTGWQFEIGGINDFGELRIEKTHRTGTEVELHLSDDIAAVSDQWFAELSEYVRRTLTFIPCKFQLTTDIPGAASISRGPGWTTTSDDWTSHALRRWNEGYWENESLPPSQRAQKAKERELRNQLRNEASERIRWMTEVFVLDDGSSSIRLHLPYFDLNGGASLAYFRVSKSGEEIVSEPIGQAFGEQLSGGILLGWRGMAASLDPEEEQRYEPPMNMLVEIDLRTSDAGSIEVNRNTLALENGDSVFGAIEEKAAIMMERFLKENATSRYATANHHLAGLPMQNGAICWLVPHVDATATWEELDPPLTADWMLPHIPPSRLPPPSLQWAGTRINVVKRMKIRSLEVRFGWSTFPPDRIGFYKAPNGILSPIGLWTDRDNYDSLGAPGFDGVVRLPPSWKGVVGVKLNEYRSPAPGISMANADNWLTQLVDASGWEWSRRTFWNSPDPRPFRNELLTSKGKAAAWLVSFVLSKSVQWWNDLVSFGESSFFQRIWIYLSIPPEAFLCFVSNSEIHVVTPIKWQVRKPEELTKILPEPDDGWIVTAE